MELVKAVGKSWHKSCLRCGVCNKVLRDGNWEDKGGKVYCTPCFEKNFMDADTKQLIWDMENSHSKKVHGGARAIIPGAGPPPPALRPKASSPPPPPPTTGPGPTSPKRTLGTALQNDIVSRAGPRPATGNRTSPRGPPPIPGRGRRF